MIRQSDENGSNLLETLETKHFFGQVVHWASGKPTDTKGASDNSRSIR
jgi:hypothetical protein